MILLLGSQNYEFQIFRYEISKYGSCIKLPRNKKYELIETNNIREPMSESTCTSSCVSVMLILTYLFPMYPFSTP